MKTMEIIKEILGTAILLVLLYMFVFLGFCL